MEYRIEKDTLGKVKVPADKYWGAQTERSRNNFKIGPAGSMPLDIVHAFAYLKKAAAHANYELGTLTKDKRDLIAQVADEIAAGKLDDQFPLVIWQTGSGTQSNMNVNEVIANRAHEIAGHKIGEGEKTIQPNDDVNSVSARKKIAKQFAEYRKDYAAYYNTHKRKNSPAMRDPNPVVILYPGVGMFTFAKNKQTARVASEFYLNAINVMRGSEAVSTYVALPLQEAFDIEYWLLEEAKLQRQPAEKPLSRKVALVTGAGGGIGFAVARRLVNEGAVVVLSDINAKNLQISANDFTKDQCRTFVADVTKSDSVKAAFDYACLEFGGVDIVVHSAGVAISQKLEDTTEKDWDFLQNILVKGQLFLAQNGASIMRKQKTEGDIINIVSKNGLVAGPNNVGYGTAKAAQLHMSRLLAAELGPDKIRVNSVNPDAVIVGSKIWEGKWAAGRAKAYGVKVEDLPAHYAKRTLLNEIILPDDIAKAVASFLIDLRKSTGNIVNVDGGVAAAFVR